MTQGKGDRQRPSAVPAEMVAISWDRIFLNVYFSNWRGVNVGASETPETHSTFSPSEIPDDNPAEGA